MGLQGLQQAVVVHNVHLVSYHNLGPGGKLRVVLGKLQIDGVKIRHWIPALATGHVYHMDQQAAAVDVPQEVMAQTGAFTGSLNNAGDISHDEADALVYIDHAQVGEEGGEVVIGDLGPGFADHAEEGGFAHVGEAHQTNVRQQFQLQHHVVALSGQTALGKAGGLAGGGGKMGVAPAALAATAEDIGLAAGHVLDNFVGFGVPDQGAPGNADDQGLSVLAAFALACAVHAVFCYILALVAEVHQGGEIVIHLKDDVAAVTAVAAVRAAGGNIFFTVEGYAAVAAVAGLYGDAGLVHKGCRHRAPPDFIEFFF